MSSPRGIAHRAMVTSTVAAMVILIIVGSGISFSSSSLASSATSTSSSLPSSPATEVPSSTRILHAPLSIIQASFAASVASTTSETPALSNTGIIVPLFTENSAALSSEVNEVVQAKLAHTVVPIIVIINPAGGPGDSYNPSIAVEVESMQAAGITVIGYVPTGWGEASISSIEVEMLTYLSWYGVNGTYLDQMPNWNYNSPNGAWYYTGPNGEFIPAYFATLNQYGKSIGMTEVVANSGADVPVDFIGSVDAIGTFENAYLPSLSLTAGWTSIAGVGGWHTGYSKSNFMFFSYAVPSLASAYVLAASGYMGYMYITNGTGTAPYSTLSPYFDQMVSLLASKVPVTIQQPTTLNGASTTGGPWVTATKAERSSTSGYTPSTFDVDLNSSVSI